MEEVIQDLRHIILVRYDGIVPCPERCGIGDRFVNGEWSKASPEPEE